MSTWLIVLIVLAVIALIVLLAMFAFRKRKSPQNVIAAPS